MLSIKRSYIYLLHIILLSPQNFLFLNCANLIPFRNDIDYCPATEESHSYSNKFNQQKDNYEKKNIEDDEKDLKEQFLKQLHDKEDKQQELDDEKQKQYWKEQSTNLKFPIQSPFEDSLKDKENLDDIDQDSRTRNEKLDEEIENLNINASDSNFTKNKTESRSSTKQPPKDGKRAKSLHEEFKNKNQSFKDILKRQGGLNGMLSEIVNNEEFQDIAIFLKKYPFVVNVLKTLFDLGLGGLRAMKGGSCCRSGDNYGGGFDTFESPRRRPRKSHVDDGKNNMAGKKQEKEEPNASRPRLSAEDFENLLHSLDSLKKLLESDPELLEITKDLDKDPWRVVGLLAKPDNLQKIFDSLGLGNIWGKDTHTGMKRTIHEVLREMNL